MAIWIAGARRDDRDRGPDGLEERAGRGRARSVVGDLEQVQVRQAPGEKLRVDALLDVAGQEEAPAANLAQEHDRDVVDARAGVARLLGHAVGVRPQHAEADRVERQPIAGRQAAAWRPSLGEDARPGVVARARSDHARLVDSPDPVSLQQEREPRHVVLVGMREHEDVDPPVPRRQSLAERDEEPPRIRPTVHDHAAAATALDEDPVSLPHVQDDHARESVRPVRDDERQRDDRTGERGGRQPAAPARLPSAGRAIRDGGRTSRGAAGPPRRQQPTAQAGDREEQDGGQPRGDRVPRRAELDARQRQARAESHGRHDRRVQDPGRQPEEDREDPRQAEAGEDAGSERERAGGHRRRDERHHDEVHRRRDHRQAAELQQDHGRRRRLRGQRDAENLGEPPPQTSRVRT